MPFWAVCSRFLQKNFQNRLICFAALLMRCWLLLCTAAGFIVFAYFSPCSQLKRLNLGFFQSFWVNVAIFETSHLGTTTAAVWPWLKKSLQIIFVTVDINCHRRLTLKVVGPKSQSSHTCALCKIVWLTFTLCAPHNGTSTTHASLIFPFMIFVFSYSKWFFPKRHYFWVFNSQDHRVSRCHQY